jgi:hypothetical protein
VLLLEDPSQPTPDRGTFEAVAGLVGTYGRRNHWVGTRPLVEAMQARGVPLSR